MGIEGVREGVYMVRAEVMGRIGEEDQGVYTPLPVDHYG